MTQTKLQQELKDVEHISVVELVEALIQEANRALASDIHIHPVSKSVLVQFRIDGILRNACELPRNVYPEVISRIKILADLRTDEHQSPQDGRFRTDIEGGGTVDIRVSIAPTYYGQNIVMRLLTEKKEEVTLATLGFGSKDREKIEQAIKRTHGMILVTGPTGSGKTTTLYTLIRMLNTGESSVVTIEDPIEYALEEVEQIQVNDQTSLTFANGLRCILRQDPDVIMVGEIRDAETARISINAALTGHLLFSTLHTNDAASNLPRLIDMGIEPYLIASTVNLVIGQRLMRKICPKCKTKNKISSIELKSLSEAIPPEALHDMKAYYHGKGCDACGGSGYSGRIGTQEVLVVSNEIREAILRKASASEIQELAVKNGMVTMVYDALEKAASGITTIQEVLRVIHE